MLGCREVIFIFVVIRLTPGVKIEVAALTRAIPGFGVNNQGLLWAMTMEDELSLEGVEIIEFQSVFRLININAPRIF